MAGADGEVRGRAFEIERDHPQARPGDCGELVDGGPAGGEIRHHLARHLGRESRNALCHHAVIAGEHQNRDAVEPGRVAALPAGEPRDEFLQAPETARRLGQPGIALPAGGRGRFVAGGQIQQAARNSANDAKCAMVSRSPKSAGPSRVRGRCSAMADGRCD